MILAVALLAAIQTAPTDRDDSRQPEIVVNAMRKLEDWRGVLVFARDVPSCRVVTSAKDADLDAIGCKSLVQCYVDTKPQFLAVNNPKLSARARRQMRIDANRVLDACFKSSRLAMVQDLTRRREAAAAAEGAAK